MIDSFLLKFRRITSSNNFIPEIDGLRFLAILSVIMFHSASSVAIKGNWLNLDKNIINVLLFNGNQGVELFFAISGFILSLPFALQYLNKEKAVNLKQYYLRRITRLEPPYIIAIVGMTFFLIFIGVYSFKNEIYHLVSSIFYLHNTIYQTSNSVLGGVTWSLEVEVQFYIIAPLLALFFKLRPLFRRTIFLTIMIFAPLFNGLLPFDSLLGYIQFFIVGFLICDLYISRVNFNMNRFVSFFITFICVFLLFFIENRGLNNFSSYIYPSILALFFYLVLVEKACLVFFTNRYVITIGGMCYTIYLLHFPIVGFIGNFSIPIIHFNNFYIVYIVNLSLFCVFILIASGFYFQFIEKPCMKKNWPSQLKTIFIKYTMPIKSTISSK